MKHIIAGTQGDLDASMKLNNDKIIASKGINLIITATSANNIVPGGSGEDLC